MLGDSAEAPPPAVVAPAREEPSLRSLKELLGYALVAEDGPVGHVEDLIDALAKSANDVPKAAGLRRQ